MSVGQLSEAAVLGVLELWGWTIRETQYEIAGHRLDALVEHPTLGSYLVEVKSWLKVSGRDTVKKAIADAADLWVLRRNGQEVPPYMLVLSEPMSGLLDDMLRRAQEAGFIAYVVVVHIARPEGLPPA
jgi:hypothetical protein